MYKNIAALREKSMSTILVPRRQVKSTLGLQTGSRLKYRRVETVTSRSFFDARPQLAVTLEGSGRLHPPQATNSHTHIHTLPAHFPFCPHCSSCELIETMHEDL